VVALLASRYACEVSVRVLFETPALHECAAGLPPSWSTTAGARRDRLARMDSFMNEFEV
jgi:hypothetical protein